MFNSVISILIGIFGILIAHVIYVIIDGKWLNGDLTIIIFAIMEFIEILLLFKKKNWKAFIISIYKVTSIGEKAFYGCEKLYHVKLPNSIKNIENYAFAESGLYSINIPVKKVCVELI